MAEGLRAQVAALAALAAPLALFAACGAERPETGGHPTSSQPVPVDHATLDAAQLVDRVLGECHAVLRGSLSAIAATITLPGGETIQAYADLPRAIRTTCDRGQLVLCGDDARSLGDDPRAATAAERARLAALRELLDVATLGPLYRAVGCRRLEESVFELRQEAGPPIHLHLREDTLLPAALTGPFGTITIDDYVHSPVTWITAAATHPQLGACRMVFEQSGMTFAPDFFAPDRTRTAEHPGQRIHIATEAIESRSPTPVLSPARAARWLVLDDPGDWRQRAALIAPLHDTLLAQGQKIAGFPILTRLGDRDVLVIPFRPREGDALPPVARGREVLELPAGRDLVVYPPAGDFAARRAEGARLLRAALAGSGLEADGEIRCQPYFHLDEAPPTAGDLAAPTVRMSVRVR